MYEKFQIHLNAVFAETKCFSFALVPERRNNEAGDFRVLNASVLPTLATLSNGGFWDGYGDRKWIRLAAAINSIAVIKQSALNS